MVSCLSSCWAIATLVPTPSALVASSGWSYCLRAETSNRPAKPPMPPITSGRRVFSTHVFNRSTARSPASRETPAAAYVDPVSSVIVPSSGHRAGSRPGQRIGGATTGQAGRQAVRTERCVELLLEQVLAQEPRLGQV